MTRRLDPTERKQRRQEFLANLRNSEKGSNPLERVRAFIPVNDTARLVAIAEDRGVTMNHVIREAVAKYLSEVAA